MLSLATLSQESEDVFSLCYCAGKFFLPKINPVGMVDGVVAQLVERLVRNEKVAGSNPVGSTSLRSGLRLGKPAFDEHRFASNLHESGARRLPR
jgi:hypothetical protein